jgi:hypothetical protein
VPYHLPKKSLLAKEHSAISSQPRQKALSSKLLAASQAKKTKPNAKPLSTQPRQAAEAKIFLNSKGHWGRPGKLLNFIALKWHERSR